MMAEMMKIIEQSGLVNQPPTLDGAKEQKTESGQFDKWTVPKQKNNYANVCLKIIVVTKKNVYFYMFIELKNSFKIFISQFFMFKHTAIIYLFIFQYDV